MENYNRFQALEEEGPEAGSQEEETAALVTVKTRRSHTEAEGWDDDLDSLSDEEDNHKVIEDENRRRKISQGSSEINTSSRAFAFPQVNASRIMGRGRGGGLLKKTSNDYFNCA